MTIRVTKREGDYVNFATGCISTGKFWLVSLANGIKVTLPVDMSKPQIAEFIANKGWAKLAKVA